MSPPGLPGVGCRETRDSRPRAGLRGSGFAWLVLGHALVPAVVLAALAGFPDPASALDPHRAVSQYAHRVWSRLDGLPQNAVTALAEGEDGYLWIGSQEGLTRFDGVAFTAFDRRTTEVLEDQFITALAAGAGGHLWVGTRRGLLRFDGGALQRFGVGELPAPYVRALLEDRRGCLWVGTYGDGLARWERGRWSRWGPAEGLADDTVRVLHEDREGALWVGTSRGLQRFDGGEWTTFTTADGLASDFVRALAEGPDGTLWVGTEGGGLHRRGTDGRFVHLEELFGGGEVSVGALYSDPDGALWIGTSGLGLGRMTAEGFSSWSAGDGLAHDVVWCFLEDKEGSLWVGTRGGLQQLRDGSAVAVTPTEGLSNGFVRTVVEDRGGTLWIGAGGGGVDLLRDGVLEHLPLPGVAGEGVRSIYESRDGALWLGAHGAVIRVEARDRAGGGPRVTSVFTSADGLPDRDVNALAEDAEGTLWVGTLGGLARFVDGRFAVSTTADGLPDDRVRALLPRRGGGLWIGTEAGLARLDGDRLAALSPAGAEGVFVLSLYEDEDGALWIGTSGDGLLRLRDGQLHRWSERDGLWDDLIFQILEDAEGVLWMSSNRGISRVAKEELERAARGEIEAVRSRGFDEADGLPSAECNGGSQPAGWRARDGRLWFPTIGGLAVIDPRRLERNDVPPPVILEEVRIEGRPVERSRLAQGVTLPPGSRDLEIHYTAPSFVSPGKVRFRYRLDGFQQEWVEAGTRRTAFFTNLPPGDYGFQVLAANSDGVWSPAGATVELRQQPWLHQTPWFWVVCGLTAGLVAAAAYRWRIRRLTAREEELVRIVDRRTRELAEANRALEHLASYDSLTQAPNHRRFQQALDEEWRRAARAGTPMALLMIDIDLFKRYNDTYGHQKGDECLRRVAAALTAQVQRAGDLVARYGGEEFAAVLSGTVPAAARELAEGMRRAVEDLDLEHASSTVAPRVTVSIGVAATVPERGSNPDRLFAAADQALYRAKAEGRNRVR